MGPKRVAAALVGAALAVSLVAGPAAAATTSEIANQLICQCGCYAVLANCTHGECDVRDGMTSYISQKLADGQSESQIVEYFVSQYGEKVLSSPPKRGFNLTAWLLPFAAILAAGVGVFFAVRAWVKRGVNEHVPTRVVADPDDAAYEQRLEAELREYDDRGFR